jgi:nicotinamidase-related amidase
MLQGIARAWTFRISISLEIDESKPRRVAMSRLERLDANGGALLVVDAQEKLLRAIEGRDRLLSQTLRLVRAARLLGLPVFATEQYPQGLGPTVDSLAALIPDRPAKTTFHGLGAPGIAEGLAKAGVRHVTLAGIEAHVCIAQTALELLRLGYAVQVPADAVGSRFAIDREFALRRLELAGAVVSTAESALFEWVGGAEHPRFKDISALVKERAES